MKPRITEQEITNLKALVLKLYTATTGFAAFVFQRLSEEVKCLIALYATDGSNCQVLARLLAQEISSVIDGAPLYDPKLMEGIALSPKTRSCIGKTLAGSELARFHRWLFEDAFPEELTPRFNKGRQQKWIPYGPGMRHLPGSQVIHSRIKINGKEYRTKFDAKDRNDAKAKYHAWAASISKHASSVPPGKESLASYVPAYLASREKEVKLGKIKANRIENLRKSYHYLGLHWKGFNTVSRSRITPKAIAGVCTFLLTKARNLLCPSKTLSKATYNSLVSALALLLYYLKDQGKIPNELYLQLMEEIEYAKVEPRKVQIPTDEQLKAMRARLYRVRQGKSHGESGPKFDTYMLTSQRKATVNAMKMEHFNFVAHQVFLTHLKGREGEPKEAWRPMLPEFEEIIKRYIEAHGLKPGDYLWKTRNNNNAFRTAAKAVGMDRWYHHASRKWFGTKALQATKDPLGVSDMMCHRDGGKTLLEVYRQMCNDYLQALGNSMKLYPGANAGKSFEAAIARVQQAITKILGCDKEIATKAMDCILWIESKLDQREYDALSCLPQLGQKELQMYIRKPAPVAQRSSPALIKSNLHWLIKQNGLYHSDIAAQTGIPRAVIARASKSGDLQARYVIPLCEYLQISPKDFLTIDLVNPVGNPGRTETASNEAISGAAASNPDAPQPKTVEELITMQDPAQLARTVASNLDSLLLENNLTVPAIAKKSGIVHSAIYAFLQERFVPTNDSLTKIAVALEVSETEIVDPVRVNLARVPAIVSGNVKAIVAHHGLANSTYAVRVGLDAHSVDKIIKTGEIAAIQAHKIVAYEAPRITLRQLVSEDVSANLPPAPVLAPMVVARNIRSACWERGIYPAELAQRAGISTSSALNYANGKSRRIDRELLTKLAKSLDMTLADLVDSSRPELGPTPLFHSNLMHLIELSGLPLTLVVEACHVDFKALRALAEGAAPNPHQVAKIARFFKISCRGLLAEDLRDRNLTSGEPTPSTPASAGQTPEGSHPSEGTASAPPTTATLGEPVPPQPTNPKLHQNPGSGKGADVGEVPADGSSST